DILSASALLHDIGTYVFFANAGIQDKRYYKQHAILGAKIIQDEGYQQKIADVVETHILMGLSQEDIIDKELKLPLKDYQPTSIEAEILCYADRFHSKEPVFNTYKAFYERLRSDFPSQAKKMEEAAQRFGVPDLLPLAKKYG